MCKIKQFFEKLFNCNSKTKFKVGDKVMYVSGRYFHDPMGNKPYGYKNRDKQVYVTKIDTNGTHPYHISIGEKFGDGDLGWLKEEQIDAID